MQSADVLASMKVFEDPDLREIAASVEAASRGEVSEKAAFAAITQVVRRRTQVSAEIYQKPLG